MANEINLLPLSSRRWSYRLRRVAVALVWQTLCHSLLQVSGSWYVLLLTFSVGARRRVMAGYADIFDPHAVSLSACFSVCVCECVYVYVFVWTRRSVYLSICSNSCVKM